MIYGKPMQFGLWDRIVLVWSLLWGKWEPVAYLNRHNRRDLLRLIEEEGTSGARMFRVERVPAVFVPGLWESGSDSLVRLFPVGGDGDVIVLRQL